jgi:hypothetical protein
MNPETLRQLIANCRRKKGRFLGFPRDWCPHRIPNPRTPGYPFSDDSAFELIADHLESGQAFDVIALDNPVGAVALAITVKIDGMSQPLYIKVQVGQANVAIGRSFHPSERY